MINNRIFKKLFRRVLFIYFYRRRYSYIAAKVSIDCILDEIYLFPEISFVEKLKIYKAGYFVYTKLLQDKIGSEYDLLPPIKYYKLHPINERYSSWIDDKITFRYLLEPFKAYLPKYYLQIERGKVLSLPDFPKDMTASKESFLPLLKRVGKLACKPLNGSGGNGFIKLEISDNDIIRNGCITSAVEVIDELFRAESFLISEFIEPCASLRVFNNLSTATIRVVAIRDKEKTTLTGAYLRTGTQMSGFVDNMSKGGVLSAVEVSSGKILSPILQFTGGDYQVIEAHPDTGKPIQGQFSNWKEVIEVLKQIGDYCPQLKYIGYDIAMTDDGFRILEMNSLQDLINIEWYFGLKPDPVFMSFFNKRCQGILRKTRVFPKKHL